MARLALLAALIAGAPVAALPLQTPALPVCPAHPLPPREAGGAPVYLPCQLDREPRLVGDSLDVLYPGVLQSAGIEGLARVQLIITASGAVDSASATVTGSMHPGFDAVARAAALGARFTPGRIGARAVASLVTLDFEFALGEALRSEAAAEAARMAALRADTTPAARVVALRRIAAVLGGRAVRVFPFDATWDARRHRPSGGCGPYRVYVSPPAVAGPPPGPGRVAAVRAFADSLASDSATPDAVRAAAFCLGEGLSP
ncbi:MAG TPA: TonB family protein [Gemmatimonadales bacterium]|nr:TonB family protein [Gemmatimonadales bacterium]